MAMEQINTNNQMVYFSRYSWHINGHTGNIKGICLQQKTSSFPKVSQGVPPGIKPWWQWWGAVPERHLAPRDSAGDGSKNQTKCLKTHHQQKGFAVDWSNCSKIIEFDTFDTCFGPSMFSTLEREQGWGRWCIFQWELEHFGTMFGLPFGRLRIGLIKIVGCIVECIMTATEKSIFSGWVG